MAAAWLFVVVASRLKAFLLTPDLSTSSIHPLIH
jgi:hypothetical protein